MQPQSLTEYWRQTHSHAFLPCACSVSPSTLYCVCVSAPTFLGEVFLSGLVSLTWWFTLRKEALKWQFDLKLYNCSKTSCWAPQRVPHRHPTAGGLGGLLGRQSPQRRPLWAPSWGLRARLSQRREPGPRHLVCKRSSIHHSLNPWPGHSFPFSGKQPRTGGQMESNSLTSRLLSQPLALIHSLSATLAGVPAAASGTFRASGVNRGQRVQDSASVRLLNQSLPKSSQAGLINFKTSVWPSPLKFSSF